ncbi:hypothetical protein [Streptomyces tropicalis]|uniref:Lipoprotein n=1 Tax=Streptomyces tropicalis TaxID=3034234 RepID=A0ABT5ZXM4_9ACTN|nr:hypothetical protein [Streptomyces tropicalis]MDF3297149.1 hypothetical protein [Streptomyces tropicalis]
MAGRGRASGSWAVALCLALASTASLTSCGDLADTARGRVQQVLDRRARAVLHHDERAFDATGDGTQYANLRAVPLTDWSYRLTSLHRTGGTATAGAELRYRVTGYDSAPVTSGRTLTLAAGPQGTWRVVSDRPAAKASQQLWDQGPVTVVRGRSSLVLGVGQSSGTLHGYAGLADRAVPAVSDAWGTGWSRHVVVLVPRTLDGMAGLLGSPASQYRGIAAVTTGEAGGSGRTTPADRIIVNPDAYGMLGGLGKQVVLTHETTHVATRARTDPATPLWLSEGYADWIGYRGTGRTPAQAAPELQRAVAAGQVPAALPTDRDFGFAGDATRLAQAYESGWMACRLIAGRWGEDRLRDFYVAVGRHRHRSGAVEDALRRVLHTAPGAFTDQWRAYLRAQLG